LAGSVSAITCTNPRPDHIRQLGSIGAIPINADFEAAETAERQTAASPRRNFTATVSALATSVRAVDLAKIAFSSTVHSAMLVALCHVEGEGWNWRGYETQ
jgi:hypothetical protein